MSTARDFRRAAFDLKSLEASGKHVGRNVYWKLYSIENTLRVLIHSVLIIQYPPPDDWWRLSANQKMKDGAEFRRKDYLGRPWHGIPGKHSIYYVFLDDLATLIELQRPAFDPIITDVANWIAKIREVRLPRNIVGHMNWPQEDDKKRIDLAYSDLQHLVKSITDAGKISFVVPA